MASFTFLSDSNVKNFWDEALIDRKELQDRVSVIKVTSMSLFDQAMGGVASGHVVLSLMTNPIVDHVASVNPVSQDTLEASISSVVGQLFEAIFGFCFKLKDSKVVLRNDCASLTLRYLIVPLSTVLGNHVSKCGQHQNYEGNNSENAKNRIPEIAVYRVVGHQLRYISFKATKFLTRLFQFYAYAKQAATVSCL
jgi:hypothetical protein